MVRSRVYSSWRCHLFSLMANLTLLANTSNSVSESWVGKIFKGKRSSASDFIIAFYSSRTTDAERGVQRARAAPRGHVSRANRAPLQRLVRRRVAGLAAAPSCRALNLRDESYRLLWSAATDCKEATISPARRRPYIERSWYADV